MPLHLLAKTHSFFARLHAGVVVLVIFAIEYCEKVLNVNMWGQPLGLDAWHRMRELKDIIKYSPDLDIILLQVCGVCAVTFVFTCGEAVTNMTNVTRYVHL